MNANILQVGIETIKVEPEVFFDDSVGSVEESESEDNSEELDSETDETDNFEDDNDVKSKGRWIATCMIHDISLVFI